MVMFYDDKEIHHLPRARRGAAGHHLAELVMGSAPTPGLLKWPNREPLCTLQICWRFAFR